MPEPKRPLKVFLCHASTDKPKVRDLYRFLKRRGIQPWFDEVNLIGGQDWQVEIPKALATSDAIIICLTKDSVDKEGYIQKEIKFALDKALEMPEGRIFLIPVKFEECDLPYSLSQFQWVDLFSSEAGYTKMMKALKYRAEQLDRSPTIEFSKKVIQEEALALRNAALEKSDGEATRKFSHKQAEEYIAADKLTREQAGRSSAVQSNGSASALSGQRKINPLTVILLGFAAFIGVIFCITGLLWVSSFALPKVFPSAPASLGTTNAPSVTNELASITPTLTPIPFTNDMIVGSVEIACGNDVSFVSPTPVGNSTIDLFIEEHANSAPSTGSEPYLELPVMFAQKLNLGSAAVKSSIVSNRVILDVNALLAASDVNSRCIFYWKTSSGYFGGETTYSLAANQNIRIPFLYWITVSVNTRPAERAQFYYVVESTAKPTRANVPKQPTKVPATPTP